MQSATMQNNSHIFLRQGKGISVTLLYLKYIYFSCRSTPHHDTFYGGQSDLQAAYGWEEDGNTILRFKKKLGGDGTADQPFQGDLTLIWAHGQDQSTNSFYANDELKFHLTENSGVASISKFLPLVK